MGVRGFLGLPDLPAEPPVGMDSDGVLAEITLRDALRPRLLSTAKALFCLYPPSNPATPDDHDRWARVQEVGAAMDRGDAESALAGLAALDALVEF